MGGTILKKRCKFYEPNCNVQSDMARRRSRKTAKKLPPTELTILAAAAAPGTFVADVGSLLSQINRKSFRQGYQYAIQSIKILSYSAPVTTVTIGRLPHHWPCINAWTKTMNLWRQQQNDRLQDSGLTQTIAAHRDFKIYMNADHADGVFGELQAQTFTGTGSGLYRTLAQGQAVSATVDMDWDKSEVVIPNHSHVPGDTEEYYCHMLGDDSFAGATASFGMIKAYAESRNRPMQTDPNIVDVASGGVFGQMFNIGEDMGEIVENAQDKNVAFPYLNDIDSAIEFYPGGSEQGDDVTLVDALQIVAAGNRTMASSTVGPFLANCGLILLSTDQPCSFLITVAPGDYKGVMARPMQDVN